MTGNNLGVIDIQTGEFGAYMAVYSVNDGPFTLIVDTKDLEAPK